MYTNASDTLLQSEILQTHLMSQRKALKKLQKFLLMVLYSHDDSILSSSRHNSQLLSSESFRCASVERFSYREGNSFDVVMVEEDTFAQDDTGRSN
jgi:hypothetical protein